MSDPAISVERRREARERALALLYEAESKGISPRDVVAALPVAPDPFAAGGVNPPAGMDSADVSVPLVSGT